MKNIVAFCILLCLVHVSLQKPSIEGDCSNSTIDLKNYMNGCFSMKCDYFGDNPSIAACRSNGCGRGYKLVGTIHNPEKEYPDCCVVPICESLEPYEPQRYDWK